jgi:hypothetical protein
MTRSGEKFHWSTPSFSMEMLESKPQSYLTFHSVLNHTDIGKHFLNFLKNEKKEETWKFIISAQLLEVFTQNANKTKATQQLKQTLTYFQPKNLEKQTSETKELFRQILEKKNSQEELFMLILEMKNKLIPTFEKNEFQRFKGTDEAKRLCRIYEKNKLLVLPNLAKEFQYQDEDFEKFSFEKKDFDFIKKIEMEDIQDWELLCSSEQMNNFLTYLNYFPQLSFLEIPQTVRKIMTFKCSLEEAAIGVLYKHFANVQIGVYFKVVDFNGDRFVIDQYVKRPHYHIRVTRSLCTLIYEGGSLLALMKPLKIPELDFLKFQDIKYFHKGVEIVERGVQDFFYIGVRITPVSKKETHVYTNSIFQGGWGSMGAPKTLMNLKSCEYFGQLENGINMAKGKKISDFKKEFNEIKDEFPVEPFAKLLYDLNVKKNVFSNLVESENKERFIHNIRALERLKLESKLPMETLMGNILNNIQKNETSTFPDGNMLSNIALPSQPPIVEEKENKRKRKKEIPKTPVVEEGIVLNNICEDLDTKEPSKKIFLQGTFLENISRVFLDLGDSSNDEKVKEEQVVNQDLFDLELNEDCLEDILNYDFYPSPLPSEELEELYSLTKSI